MVETRPGRKTISPINRMILLSNGGKQIVAETPANIRAELDRVITDFMEISLVSCRSTEYVVNVL